MTCPSILGTFQVFCACGTAASPLSLVELLFYPGKCPFHPGMCPFHPAVFPFPLAQSPWYLVVLAGLPGPNAFCLVVGLKEHFFRNYIGALMSCTHLDTLPLGWKCLYMVPMEKCTYQCHWGPSFPSVFVTPDPSEVIFPYVAYNSLPSRLCSFGIFFLL